MPPRTRPQHLMELRCQEAPTERGAETPLSGGGPKLVLVFAARDDREGAARCRNRPPWAASGLAREVDVLPILRPTRFSYRPLRWWAVSTGPLSRSVARHF